jgi:hypothetical protein
MDSFVVGGDVAVLVDLELHPAIGQLIHGPIHVVNGEIEDGERRRLMVPLFVDEDAGVVVQPELQLVHWGVRDIELECVVVELPCFFEVVHGKAGKRFGVFEHGRLL